MSKIKVSFQDTGRRGTRRMRRLSSDVVKGFMRDYPDRQTFGYWTRKVQRARGVPQR